MAVTPDPYQSPTVTHDHDAWWPKLRRLFTSPIISHRFKHGGKVITDGIAFYLDVTDATRLYAASPSPVSTDARMNLVVSEAIRAFPLFLHDNPKLQAFVRGRRITVRLIGTYADDPTKFVREHVLDWDYISEVLDNTKVDK